MKQKYSKKTPFLGAILLLFLLISSIGNSQVIIPTTNTNNGSVNDPFGTYYGYERSAMIYTNAEIGTSGNITNVGFYVNSVNTPKNAVNVRIYMKMRTTTITAVSTYAAETTGATLVYGPTTITAASFVANSWTTVALATPFNYTGNNLEIIVETNSTNNGNEGSISKQFRYTTQGNLEYYQYWNQDTTAPTGNGTRDNLRPNVSLTFASPPTITSLGDASGCVGTSLVITGTNLTGTTAVTIGGTATAITGNTPTTVTVTVSAGATGSVKVTTPGGSTTSTATFTANPLPANPGNPTSNSPQCNPPGVTLNRSGIPAVGETWYWQTTAGGTATTNFGATYLATISGTYYIRARNNVTGCWSLGSGSLAIVVSPTLTAIAIAPNPANNANGACYAGTGAVSSISWGAVVGATSYDVYFGAGSLPGSATSTVATTTYNTGTLLASTTYYWKIVPKNACGFSSGTPTTWNFTTSPTPCYCIPTGNLNCGADDYISNVTLGSLNNSTTCGAGGYTIYPASGAQTTTLVTGQTYTFNLNVGPGSGNHGAAVWIDFNQNGVFTDAGEYFLISNAIAPNGTASITIPIPAGASVGQVQMRVRYAYNLTVTSAMSCTMSGTFGETEDYTITLIIPIACTTPTAQPTTLILTPSGSVINATFTASVPGAQSYLVIVNTTGVAPTPANGTTYTIGSSMGGTNVVVDTDSNTTFSATSLVPLTTYYLFVYSMNNICTGGPLYLSTLPLTGNAVANYCIPTVNTTNQTSTDHHIRKVEFIGTLQDIVNTSSFPTVAPFGYSDYTGLATKAIQAKGGVVNIYMESPNSGYIKAWIDWNKDGDFADAGETVYDAGGTSQASTTLGFIVPTSVTAGDYRVRLRISGYNGIGADAGFNWNACDANLAYFGETEDYILRVIEDCNAKITTITNGSICGSGSATLQATATSGTTEFRWYSSQTGATLLATTYAGIWNTPSISSTTTYWTTAYNGSCETLARTKVKAIVKPIPSLTFASPDIEICGENFVALTATGDTETIYLIDENFEGGMGTFSNNHIVSNAAVNSITAWQIKTGPYVPTGTTWFPAIASNFGANNFAFVNSDIGVRPCAFGPCYYTINNALLSNVVNSTGFLDLTLKFRVYFDRYFPNTVYPAEELMQVEISTNGTVWTSVSGDLINDIGYGGVFSDLSYNLNAYINQPNLRVRIRYFTNTWANGGAVDDVELFGNKPLVPNFTWTSAFPIDAYTDLAFTIPYTSGTPVSTVYVKPTLAQLENTNFSFTANANLANGCTSSGIINVTNKSSIWKGTVSNDWNNPNNWLPVGIPTINTCVIIPDVTTINPSKVTGTNFNGFGKTLQVKNLGNLQIQPTNTLTIADEVTIDTGGTFNIEDSGSLVQINNIANSGNINYKRIAPSIRGFDYVYWSSPVANQAMETIYSSPVSGFKYAWNTTVPNGNAGIGNWEDASGVMQRAKGYIIRGSSSYGMPATNIAATFTGVPHNGTIPFTVARGSYTGGNYNGTNGIQITNLDDNFNLLGNPYPSAIDAKAFLTLNTYDASTNPSGVLMGNVKLWSHGAAPANIINPFYGSFIYNYTANDYVIINSLGSIPPTLGSIIKSGQAFLVQMVDGAPGTGIVNFNNTMRLKSGVPHDNGSFFRNSSTTNQTTAANEETENHRIWLDLIDSNNNASGTLVGYASGASDDFDTFFDARSSVPNYMKLYSLIDNEVYEIQGKSVPFNPNDQIPLGITTVAAGNYTIGLNTIDGLFLDASQAIYLEDKTTNVIHNLKTSPYNFTNAAGTFNDRFVLRYNNETLGNNQFTSDAYTVTVISSNQLAVKSTSKEIQSVRVFDILGRELAYYPNVNSYEIPLTKIQKNNTTLIIKVTLSNGAIISKKAIY